MTSSTMTEGPGSQPTDSQPTEALLASETLWPNTNCYLDVWRELLPSMGLVREPAMVCALSASFVGEQWEFLKVSASDLDDLYGIKVGEYDIWRPLTEHLEFQQAAGNLCLIEVDAYFLPDTAGTSYRTEHVKTALAVLHLDTVNQTLRYSHNGARFQLSGVDYAGIFGPAAAQGLVPKPYVELLRLDQRVARTEAQLRSIATKLLQRNLNRLPTRNPVTELGNYLLSQEPELVAGGMDYYHGLCFATTRQLGVTAMLAAEFCLWLAKENNRAGAALSPSASVGNSLPERNSNAAVRNAELIRAADEFTELSARAKSLQFTLARVARGRGHVPADQLLAMAQLWSFSMGLVQTWLLAHA